MNYLHSYTSVMLRFELNEAFTQFFTLIRVKIWVRAIWYEVLQWTNPNVSTNVSKSYINGRVVNYLEQTSLKSFL